MTEETEGDLGGRWTKNLGDGFIKSKDETLLNPLGPTGCACLNNDFTRVMVKEEVVIEQQEVFLCLRR